MNVVFDLDGVLIDSAHLVRRAYAHARVDAPDDILCREGDDWLARHVPDAQAGSYVRWLIYQVKNAAYVRLLGEVAPERLVNPAYDAACKLQDMGCRVHVMTAAPYGALAVLRDVLPSWPFDRAVENVRIGDKIKLMARMDDPGVYVDDQPRHELPAGWRFIHYVDQQALPLVTEILGSEER